MRFVLRHDSRHALRFGTLQGSRGQQLLDHWGLQDRPGSLLLVESGRLYRESEAVLRLCRYLDAPWSWAWSLHVVPKRLRDNLYRFVARNRYRWFGQRACVWQPDPVWKAYFLDLPDPEGNFSTPDHVIPA